MVNTMGALLPQARSGQVRGLAVSSAKRSALASEFPTMADQGVAGFDVTSWYGLFMPGGTPPDIINKVSADMTMILAEPAMKAKLATLGIEAAASTPLELESEARAETGLWGTVIKAAHIQPE